MTLVRGDGSAARRTRERPCAVIRAVRPQFPGLLRRHGPYGWGMGSRADPGQGCCEPGSGPGVRAAFPCACADVSPALPPPRRPGLLRAPDLGFCAGALFSFLPCLWQRSRVCWLWCGLVVGRGGGVGGVVFSSGPDFWVLDKITVTCVAVKAASLASSVRVSLGPD